MLEKLCSRGAWLKCEGFRDRCASDREVARRPELALESRRRAEIETLIRRQGGVPFVAPSMREVPLDAIERELDNMWREINAAVARGTSQACRLQFTTGSKRLQSILSDCLHHQKAWIVRVLFGPVE